MQLALAILLAESVVTYAPAKPVCSRDDLSRSITVTAKQAANSIIRFSTLPQIRSRIRLSRMLNIAPPCGSNVRRYHTYSFALKDGATFVMSGAGEISRSAPESTLATHESYRGDGYVASDLIAANVTQWDNEKFEGKVADNYLASRQTSTGDELVRIVTTDGRVRRIIPLLTVSGRIISTGVFPAPDTNAAELSVLVQRDGKAWALDLAWRAPEEAR